MKLFVSYQGRKPELLVTKRQNFDKEAIDAYYESIRYRENLGLRDKVIKYLYTKYVTNHNDDFWYIQLVYPSYQLIQNILRMGEMEFIDEFNIKSWQDVKELVTLVKIYECATTLRELAKKALIAKYVEYYEIRLCLSNRFQLCDVPDQVITNMLFNVENKILHFGRNKDFIITRRVSDNRITKAMITDDSEQEIKNLLEQCTDGQLYDVIFAKGITCDIIGHIRIRYLYWNHYDNIEITLWHPEDLVSASLHYVKVTNLDECLNLVNLQSGGNMYRWQDVQNLKNLKRIHSRYDHYQSQGSSLVEELLGNKKLEYVYLFNSKKDGSIVGDVTLSRNAGNLRHLYITQDGANYEITLDASTASPSCLHVYDVTTKVRDDVRYGAVRGPHDAVSQLKQRLVHELKQ